MRVITIFFLFRRGGLHEGTVGCVGGGVVGVGGVVLKGLFIYFIYFC